MLRKLPISFNTLLICAVVILSFTQYLTLRELRRYQSVTAPVVAVTPAAGNIVVSTANAGCTVTVNVRTLNQRSGPGEQYPIVGEASRGAVFTLLGQSEDTQWFQASASGETVWMAARYMSLSRTCETETTSTSAAAPLRERSLRETIVTPVPTATPAVQSNPVIGIEAAVTPLSPIFTAEVQYWATHIQAWAVQYELDPNVIATVIQIESCGDPTISSSAGAQGLFQVMPFHFTAGEDMLDVETNARRGLTYLLGALALSKGDVGLALAGYNGGHGVITSGRFAAETQRYYYWGSGIYAEASAGVSLSPTLQEWLTAGGASLCNTASRSQQRLS